MAFINMTIDQALADYSTMSQASQDSVNDRIERMMTGKVWPADNETVIAAVRAEQIHTAPLA